MKLLVIIQTHPAPLIISYYIYDTHVAESHFRQLLLPFYSRKKKKKKNQSQQP
jgi:hypothetical protein